MAHSLEQKEGGRGREGTEVSFDLPSPLFLPAYETHLNRPMCFRILNFGVSSSLFFQQCFYVIYFGVGNKGTYLPRIRPSLGSRTRVLVPRQAWTRRRERFLRPQRWTGCRTGSGVIPMCDLLSSLRFLVGHAGHLSPLQANCELVLSASKRELSSCSTKRGISLKMQRRSLVFRSGFTVVSFRLFHVGLVCSKLTFDFSPTGTSFEKLVEEYQSCYQADDVNYGSPGTREREVLFNMLINALT